MINNMKLEWATLVQEILCSRTLQIMLARPHPFQFFFYFFLCNYIIKCNSWSGMNVIRHRVLMRGGRKVMIIILENPFRQLLAVWYCEYLRDTALISPDKVCWCSRWQSKAQFSSMTNRNLKDDSVIFHSVPCSRLGLAEHGGTPVFEWGAGWQSGAAGFLHLLLHQLHAHSAGLAPAGEEALCQRYSVLKQCVFMDVN